MIPFKERVRKISYEYSNMILSFFLLMAVPFVYSALSRRKEIELNMKEDKEFLNKA